MKTYKLFFNICLAFIFLLSLPYSLICQNFPDSPESLFAQGNSLNKTNQVHEALKFYKLTEAAYSKEGNQKGYLETVAARANLLREMSLLPEAKELIKATLQQELNGFDDSVILGTFNFLASQIFYANQESDSALIFAKKALHHFAQNNEVKKIGFTELLIGDIKKMNLSADSAYAHYNNAKLIFEKHVGEKSPEIGYVLSRIGNLSKYLGHREKALKELSLSKKYLENSPNKLWKASVLRHLASLDRDFQDFRSGLEKCEHVKEIYLNSGRYPYELSLTYNTIGNIYIAAGDNLNAEANFQKAYKIVAKALGPLNIRTIAMLMNVGVAQKEQGLLNKGLSTYLKVRGMMEKNPVKNYNYFKIFRNIGLIHLIKKDTLKAKQYFDIAAEKGFLVLEPDAVDWVDVRLNQATTSQSPEEALAYCQLAFKAIIKTRDHSLNLENKDFEEVRNLAYLFRIISAQTLYTKTKYRQSGLQKDLIQADKLAKQGVKLSDYIRVELQSKVSQSKFFSDIKAHFYESLSINWLMKDNLNPNQRLEWAFTLMEKSKAWLLLESLKEKRASLQAGIPKTSFR